MRAAWRGCVSPVSWGSILTGVILTGLAATCASAQTPLTWEEVRTRFEGANPTIQAGSIGVDESRATETTAYLRPNPQVSASVDQFPLAGDATSPSDNLIEVGSISYLLERQHKRELRRDSARGATAIAESTQADTIRGLLFTLRTAFVQTLQAKAFRALAQDNLTSYDQVLTISRERLQGGDIARIDFNRLHLQRVQFESDVQAADVNLRTAKIQLLRLLNDTTPVEQFDVVGAFDFTESIEPLASLRQMALGTRPDLKAAQQAVDKATTDHRLAMANASTDPTVGLDLGHQQTRENSTPPLSTWIGVNVGVPLRVFDRNQGEKLRTALDITRNERLLAAARAQVLSDVDSAYATVMSTAALLHPYKESYLDEAADVRDTVTFSYQSGGASLIEFLQAQQEARAVQVSYVNLVGAFLNAVSQLNLAVGREVIP
jgi:cobalt-zinc-cadmium efflux system outer membrane protein